MSNPDKAVILCVDDEAPVLQLFKEWLAGSGYEVLTAESGAEALQSIRTVLPDLILMDVVMPGMDGYALCAQLQAQEETSNIPVVFVSILAGERDQARALALGAVDYLVKPMEQKQLLDTVHAYLETRPRWKALLKKAPTVSEGIQPADFVRFKEDLAGQVQAQPEKKVLLAKLPPTRLYSVSSLLGIDERRIAQAVASFLKLPYWATIKEDRIRLGVLPASFCKMHQVVAVSDDSGAKAFVLSNPFDWELLDTLKRSSGPGQAPRLLITEPAKITALLNGGTPAVKTKPGEATISMDDPTDNMENFLAGSEPEGKAEADADNEYEILNPYEMAKAGKLPPIIRLVNMVITDAVKAGASDIHVEPQEKILQIRYRIDGVLVDALIIPKHLQPPTLSRFKIISGMDIAEHRKPQDGRSRLRIEDRAIDLRVSTLPTQFGEKVVIRLLDSAKGLVEMDRLGLASDKRQVFERLLSSPQGMILVTGPTGSGKTSTLYSALNWLASPTKNIITLEDPIEFKIQGLNQVQINSKTGMTFATGLRSVLRQDPNIVLVGEIRDKETASIALEASQTGHLLLSTLHTNDAAATITRLLDLGIEPYKVASSVTCILAQRLVRRICAVCAVEREPSQEAAEKIGGRGRLPVGAGWKAGVGCEVCQQTGYKGRLAIHELLEVTEPIRALITRQAADHVIRDAARQAGMQTLMEDGISKAAQGLTTLEEVGRAAPRDDASVTKEGEVLPATDMAGKGTIEFRREVPGKIAEHGKVAVLILDDDQDMQTLLNKILEEAGYATTVAGDGIEALLYLGRQEFDLILSDINMPNMDGMQLLEMNNQKGITTPVIFLTAHSDEEIEQKALELGAAEFLKKPIKKDILLMRVQNVLGRQSSVRGVTQMRRAVNRGSM